VITRTIPLKKDGRVNVLAYRKCIKEFRPDLICIMHVNNETGVIEDIATLKTMAPHNAHFHCDITQSMGKMDGIEKLNADSYSFCAHKFHGPKGIGALFVKKSSILCPSIIGGQQEYGIRGGTENVPAMIGMKKAYVKAKALSRMRASKTRKLRDILERSILQIFPGSKVNGSEPRLYTTSNISIKGVDGNLMERLQKRGIYVNVGSACSKAGKSHVLSQMGVSEKLEKSTIRFSLSNLTTDDEISYTIQTIANLKE
jgi:cysteine desulfurase